MGTVNLRRAIRKLQRELQCEYCPHCAPLGLVIEEGGTLRRVPQKCDRCDLPREIAMIAYLDPLHREGEEGEKVKYPIVELPSWLVPSYQKAIESPSLKVYGGFDPSQV